MRLADGSFARLDAQKVREVLLRQAEILATGGGQGGKLPLSQAGRIQELLEQVGRSNVSDGTKELFQKLRDIDEIKGAKKPRNLKASLRPYQEQGLPLALVPPRDRLGRRPRRRHGARKDGPGARASPRGEGGRREGRAEEAVQGAHRRADERRHELAARDGQVRAVAQARALARRRPQGARGRARGRRRRHHELRAPPPRRRAAREARPSLRDPRRSAEHQEPALGHGPRGQAPQGRPPPRAHRARRSRTASPRSGRSSTS